MIDHTDRGDPWWELEGQEAADLCADTAHEVDHRTRARQDAIAENERMYEANSAAANAIARHVGLLAANMIAGCVDTILSEVTQLEALPMVLVDDASWEEGRCAEAMTSYLAHTFKHRGVQACIRHGGGDAVVAGLGAVRPLIRGSQVQYERLRPTDILMDDAECTNGPPNEIYLRFSIPKRTLKILYPKQENAIDSARSPSRHEGQDAAHARDDADRAEVIEAWHLPTTPESGDGRHIICAHGCPPFVLESYTRDRYPIAWIRVLPPRRGFWGYDLVARAVPMQLELDKLLGRVQDTIHFASIKETWVQKGSFVIATYGNDCGSIYEYTGPQPPITSTPPLLGPDTMQLIGWTVDTIRQLMMVSEMSITSEKPPGIESGTALRNLHDFQARRFVHFERSLQRAICDVAEDAIALERQLGAGHKVRFASGGKAVSKTWSDIDVPAERTLIDVAPISALSKDPAQRLQQIQEMVEKGAAPVTSIARMANHPDIEAIYRDQTAPEDLVRKQIGQILEGGDYIAPEPYQDLALARRIGAIEVQRATIDGCPPKYLAEARRWLLDVDSLVKRIAAGQLDVAAGAQAQEAAAVPPPMPPGEGAPPMPMGPGAMGPMGPPPQPPIGEA